MRKIIYSKDVQPAPSMQNAGTKTSLQKPDDWVTKIVKVIPAEIIAAYAAIQKLIEQGAKELSPAVYCVIIGVFLVFNLAYLKKFQGVTNVLQLILSSLAFLVWAYALIEPFKTFGVYSPLYSSVAIVFVTLASALTDQKK